MHASDLVTFPTCGRGDHRTFGQGGRNGHSLYNKDKGCQDKPADTVGQSHVALAWIITIAIAITIGIGIGIGIAIGIETF